LLSDVLPLRLPSGEPYSNIGVKSARNWMNRVKHMFYPLEGFRCQAETSTSDMALFDDLAPTFRSSDHAGLRHAVAGNPAP